VDGVDPSNRPLGAIQVPEDDAPARAQRPLEAAERIGAEGLTATVTETLPRERYREQMFVS